MVRWSWLLAASPPSSPGSSDTVPAQHLLPVCQLAWVLDQEARTAHELVGLLRQDPFIAFGLVLLVRRLLVLGLVLDDQALLEDHVEAGLDVLVVGLLLFLLLVALAGLLDDRGGRWCQDLVNGIGLCVILLVDVDDVLVVILHERDGLEVLDVVDVNVELLLLDDIRILCFGGLSHHFFGLGLLLSRHCGAEHRRFEGPLNRRERSSAVHLGGEEIAGEGREGPGVFGAISQAWVARQATRSLLDPQGQSPPHSASPPSAASAQLRIRGSPSGASGTGPYIRQIWGGGVKKPSGPPPRKNEGSSWSMRCRFFGSTTLGATLGFEALEVCGPVVDERHRTGQRPVPGDLRN